MSERLKSLEQQTLKKSRIIYLLKEFGNFAQTDNVQMTLDRIVDKIGNMFSPKFIKLYLYNEKNNALTLHSSFNISDKFITMLGEKFAVSADNVPTGKAVKSKGHVIIKKIYEDDYFSRWASLTQEMGFQSFLSFPLIYNDKVLGVIDMYLERYDLDDDDINLLLTLISFGATALQNAFMFERINRLSMTDDLTGLYNSRFLRERLLHFKRQGMRASDIFSVIIVDIDNFKHINDTFGHFKGDEVLREFAGVVQDNIREDDIATRYGGDEFVIIFPRTGKKEAMECAERLRDHVTPYLKQVAPVLSVSMGVASYPEDGGEIEDLLTKIDGRLYESKRTGKGKIIAC